MDVRLLVGLGGGEGDWFWRESRGGGLQLTDFSLYRACMAFPESCSHFRPAFGGVPKVSLGT